MARARPPTRCPDSELVDAAVLEGIAGLASAAGAAIMAHYRICSAHTKIDGSPVTVADLAAEAAILPGLALLLPGVPVLSEESASAFPEGCDLDAFALVDPLDGTREFLSGNGEFTVNIAVCQHMRPVAGVVYAPASERLWIGGTSGAEAMDLSPGAPLDQARNRRRITVRVPPQEGLVAVASRSHRDAETNAFLAGHRPVTCRAAGSALKFCLLAEGEADLYPRFSPTMEWDTAAGQAVLEAAGGVMRQPDGGLFLYGKRTAGFRNGPFVAASSARLLG